MFDKPTDVYAIFTKDAPSIFLNTPNNKKVNLKLEKDVSLSKQKLLEFIEANKPVSYTHLTLPTNRVACRSRWSPYH